MSELEFDPFIAKVARELKEPVAFDAQFDARVMAALEPEVISLDSRRVKQPWYRRQLAVPAPIAGLAAAAAFAGIAAVGILTRQPAAVPVAAAQGEIVLVNESAERAPIATAPVQFVYLATQARSVAVIGDFNDWQPTAMAFDSAAQAWRVALVLPVGVHEYQFLVDGKVHAVDPTAPATASDFGSPNSIVKVTPVP